MVLGATPIGSVALNSSQGPTDIWLAVRAPSASTCPAGVDGWVLLPPAGAPFDRFCAYGFFPTSSWPVANPNDLEHPDLEGLTDAQIGRVRPQAPGGAQKVPEWPTPMATVMAPHLWNHFKARAGVPAQPAGVSNNPTVRLAIVDTMPDGAPAPIAQHAPTLGGLARALVCNSTGQCAADIEHYLAMPRVKNKITNYVNGGNYGTLWELATAIADATNDSIADGFNKLVINLSLGWDPTGQPSLPANHLALLTGSSNLPATLRAVHTAVVYARCKGALILAASGNDDAGLMDRTGPLLPAGWQVHDAPSSAKCTNVFGRGSGPQPMLIANTPLVYAVGGVNHLGGPLENARPGSTPELVAPASSVTPPTGGGVLTGTSVGTLVASSASALVWALQGRLGADGAVGVVKNTATVLPWSASFCSGSTCPPVRQISLCAAQQSACQGSSDCAATACPLMPGPGSPEWPLNMFVEGAMHLLSKGPLRPVVMGAPQPVAGCGLVRLPMPNPWPGGAPCPLDKTVAARVLDTGPQPLDPMCPACFISEQNEIFHGMDLVPNIPGGAIHDVYLFVTDDLQVQYFALPGAFPESSSELFFVTPTGWTNPITKAWLQYVVYENGQPYLQGEPIIVN